MSCLYMCTVDEQILSFNLIAYLDECQSKYGNANAWRYCCKVFDLLTVAAVSQICVVYLLQWNFSAANHFPDYQDQYYCLSICNRMGRVKLRINITRVFRNCRNCPSRAATRAISAISENTSDINP